MRIPTHVLYRLLLILALAIVVAATRPGFGIQGAYLSASGPEHPIVTIPPAPWNTAGLRGRVESQIHSGEGNVAEHWERIRSGDSVTADSSVRTGPRGQATLTRELEVIQIDSSTELVLPHRTSAGTTVQHHEGNVLYEVRPRADIHFQVVTPDLVVTATGTAFSVIVQDRFTAVMVSDGHVEVHATFTGERVELSTGHMALLLGPLDRLDVHRDPSEGLLPIPRDEAREVRESRHHAGRLIRRAAEDNLGAPFLYDFDSGTYRDAGGQATLRRFDGLEVGGWPGGSSTETAKQD